MSGIEGNVTKNLELMEMKGRDIILRDKKVRIYLS